MSEDEKPEMDPYKTLYEAWAGVLTTKEVTSIESIPASWDTVTEPLRGAFIGALSELRRQMRAQQSGEESLERERKQRAQLNTQRLATREIERKLADEQVSRRAAGAGKAAAEAELDRIKRNAKKR